MVSVNGRGMSREPQQDKIRIQRTTSPHGRTYSSILVRFPKDDLCNKIELCLTRVERRSLRSHAGSPVQICQLRNEKQIELYQLVSPNIMRRS